MSEEHQHNTTGFICTHVLFGERKLNRVLHELDGDWQFLCGELDHFSADQGKVICTGCAFRDYVDGLQIDDIPIGNVAERPNPNHRWVIRPMTADELYDEEETQ